MNKTLSILSILIMTSFSLQAKQLKTTTIVGGAKLHFVETNYNVDCNGTGFQGTDLETLSYDRKAKVKVVKVTANYLEKTLMSCPTEHKRLKEPSITYSTHPLETVVLIMPDSMDVVIEK